MNTQHRRIDYVEKKSVKQFAVFETVLKYKLFSVLWTICQFIVHKKVKYFINVLNAFFNSTKQIYLIFIY